MKNILKQTKRVQQIYFLRMAHGSGRLGQLTAWHKANLDRDLASAKAIVLIRMAVVLIRAFAFATSTLLLFVKMDYVHRNAGNKSHDSKTYNQFNA